MKITQIAAAPTNDGTYQLFGRDDGAVYQTHGGAPWAKMPGTPPAFAQIATVCMVRTGQARLFGLTADGDVYTFDGCAWSEHVP